MMVDDERDILELSEMALERKNDNLDTETTTNPQEVIDRVVNDEVDAIVSDYNMPEMTGVELLQEVREIDDNLPFILYTGAGTEEIAENAINSGVTDYFQKEAGLDHYEFISNEIENSVEKYRDREKGEVLSVVVENSNHPIIVTDTDSTILYANEALENVSGYTEEEMQGKTPHIFSSEEHTDEDFQEMYESLAEGDSVSLDGMKNRSKDGEVYIHDQEVIPISVHRDDPDYFVGISEVRA